jgi:hypothetical protein
MQRQQLWRGSVEQKEPSNAVLLVEMGSVGTLGLEM